MHIETLLSYWYLAYFQILPLPRPKTTFQTAQKPKGGPLDEKTIFFLKNVLPSFSNMIQMTAFVVLIPKTYIPWDLTTCRTCIRSVHAVQSMHGACTGPRGCLDPTLCMFLESAQQMQSF